MKRFLPMLIAMIALSSCNRNIEKKTEQLKIKKWISWAFMLCSLPVLACLNGESRTLKNGFLMYQDHEGGTPYGHVFYADRSGNLIHQLDSLYHATGNLDYLSDIGYVLTVGKKYKEAIYIYLKIEKLQPNRYATASNLGTIYELMGENQKAYDWIKKAITIDPKSHEGSEWLHLNILKSKLSLLASDANSLTGTNFGNAVVPESRMSQEELERMSKHLFYQLNERVSFIETKDPVIASLYFQLGNVHLLLYENNDAIGCFGEALKYGFDRNALTERMQLAFDRKGSRQMNKISRLRWVNQYHQNLFVATLVISLIVVFVLMGVIFNLRKKLRKSQASESDFC